MKTFSFVFTHANFPVMLSFSVTAKDRASALRRARRVFSSVSEKSPASVVVDGVRLDFSFSALPMAADIVDCSPA